MLKIARYISQLTNRIVPNGPAQTHARHQVSPPLAYSNTALPSLSVPTRPGSPIPIDSGSGGSPINHAHRWIGDDSESTNRRQCLVDILPDDVLVTIFDFCADENGRNKKEIEAWQTLVHVCRRWRSVVFGSPRHLNLRLVCSAKTPARDTLYVWPGFPLVIQCYDYSIKTVDNVVAVLKHSNRVHHIFLTHVSSSYLENVLATMQEPFPELTHLTLYSLGTVPVVPDSFLGGSVPRLRVLDFLAIPFPGLPKLLLSATHLVELYLRSVPHSGYFSPETVVTALSTLTSLRELHLKFQSSLSRPDRAIRLPPTPTRFVLPVLSIFLFRGVSEYLDDLVARIDAPQLLRFDIIFFDQIIFNTPQLTQFISRTPMLEPFEKACVIFHVRATSVKLLSHTSGDGGLEVKTQCSGLRWQVLSLEQVCTSCSPPLSTLEDLYIYEYLEKPDKQDNIENALWLELLQPFTTVKNLYLSEEFARRIVPTLQELVDGGVIEVLPSLRNIFLEGIQTSGPVHEGIQQFFAMRQASHSIAVSSSRWDRDRRIF